ncbi:MAG: C39 family peptidase [Candidatus Doudnabacteria bacterium]
MNKSYIKFFAIIIIIVAAFTAVYLLRSKTQLGQKVVDKITGTPPPPPDTSFNPTVPDAVQASYVKLNVPFTSQAPTGNWADPREEDGCEEASVLMAWSWIKDQPLNPTDALKTILDMSAFETAHYGNYDDTDAQDTAKFFTDYYGYTNLEVKIDPSIDDIKNELRAGKLVLAPANGQKLGNPHYTAPGPLTHFMVIKGFDDSKGIFITNDAGTQYGKDYTYKYQVLYDALVNYPSGHHESQAGRPKAMIVVTK